jgi:hypothetical protein
MVFILMFLKEFLNQIFLMLVKQQDINLTLGIIQNHITLNKNLDPKINNIHSISLINVVPELNYLMLLMTINMMLKLEI